MEEPILSHRQLAAGPAEPATWLYVLHGLFGAGRNWAAVSRQLVERRTDWGIVLVDLRLHAGSRGFHPPHTLAACAADVRRLAEHIGSRPAALLGHSFGGKVALVAARLDAAGLRQVWVMDSTPAARRRTGNAAAMLRFVERRRSFADRDEAATALLDSGFTPAVARWMVTNLERRAGTYRWRFDLEGVASLLDDFFREDLWDVVEHRGADLELHFVRAAGSGVMTDEECRRLERAGPHVRVHRVAGGHWLNADNPEAVLQLLESRLP